VDFHSTGMVKDVFIILKGALLAHYGRKRHYLAEISQIVLKAFIETIIINANLFHKNVYHL
jgi:hypothetical protein